MYKYTYIDALEYALPSCCRCIQRKLRPEVPSACCSFVHTETHWRASSPDFLAYPTDLQQSRDLHLCSPESERHFTAFEMFWRSAEGKVISD